MIVFSLKFSSAPYKILFLPGFYLPFSQFEAFIRYRVILDFIKIFTAEAFLYPWAPFSLRFLYVSLSAKAALFSPMLPLRLWKYLVALGGVPRSMITNFLEMLSSAGQVEISSAPISQLQSAFLLQQYLVKYVSNVAFSGSL